MEAMSKGSKEKLKQLVREKKAGYDRVEAKRDQDERMVGNLVLHAISWVKDFLADFDIQPEHEERYNHTFYIGDTAICIFSTGNSARVDLWPRDRDGATVTDSLLFIPCSDGWCVEVRHQMGQKNEIMAWDNVEGADITEDTFFSFLFQIFEPRK